MSDPKAAAPSGPILVEAVEPGIYGGRRIEPGMQFTIADLKDFSDADRKIDDGSGKTGLPVLRGWMRKVDLKTARTTSAPISTEERLARLERAQAASAKENAELRAENDRLKAAAEAAKAAGAGGKDGGKAGGKDGGKA